MHRKRFEASQCPSQKSNHKNCLRNPFNVCCSLFAVHSWNQDRWRQWVLTATYRLSTEQWSGPSIAHLILSKGRNNFHVMFITVMALLNLYIRKYLDILQYLRSMWTKNNLFDMIILILRKRETICCSLRQSVLEGFNQIKFWLDYSRRHS